VRNDLATRAKEIALTLTSWPSVTGSKDEAEFSVRLAGFIQGFDDIWTEAIESDLAGRSNVFAIKRGRSKKTIVLTGHFDVVPIDDYGTLKPLAFESERLLPEIIAKLKISGENPLALADFESGDFLPGRGLLDMKAGLAAALAAAESYQGDATILFLAVCDEEERSAGARSAALQLREIAKLHDLDIALVINLDAISDQDDGSRARVVTYGSIGKQLLTALVVGKEAHAGYPQDGINAAYIAAELITEFELSEELVEKSGSEVTAAPTVLHAKDLKQGYNVTTPAAAWVYWNTMQYRRSGAEVLEIAMASAKLALKRAELRTGWQVELMTYGELAERTSVKPKRQDQALDLPEQARRATIKMIGAARITKPTVILGFGSIPYPAVKMKNEILREKISKAVAPFGIGSLDYFAGISDMSFFGEASGELSVVAENTPVWGSSFIMREAAGYPCINLGPWGRDYHHWLERLNAPYAFEVLPRALLAVIDAVV
jgi:arginine utilization protein RocB